MPLPLPLPLPRSVTLLGTNAVVQGVGEVASPVLLDFGLAKTMPDAERLAFAKMVYAAEESDYQLLLEAFSEMGLVLNRENPMRDMQVCAVSLPLPRMMRSALPWSSKGTSGYSNARAHLRVVRALMSPPTRGSNC